ncbi:hypothetical protein CNEO4_620016 [Clostridium neonatale]|nr:hypothetical protein CNEO4_620016 [Clostridium neonatale]
MQDITTSLFPIERIIINITMKNPTIESVNFIFILESVRNKYKL